jgi:aconitate hydratase
VAQGLDCRAWLEVGSRRYLYHSLALVGEALGDVARLPKSLKVLLENLLRAGAALEDIKALIEGRTDRDIMFRPARVLLQDIAGIPAIIDLAAMREAVAAAGGDPEAVNPMVPAHLVIDHSVMVDAFGAPEAFDRNAALDHARNVERYRFLKWGASAFSNLQVIPPGTGICHQVNLEHLARGVWTSIDKTGAELAYPDTLVGTDSHTTMVNAIGVLGWGVGGIEAEAAMLGLPLSMLVPEVVGVRLDGAPAEGITAADIVLTVTQRLRAYGVVGRFVEFFGQGVASLSLADRATLANMAPEYGATAAFFPVDARTIDYLRLTGRPAAEVDLAEAYWRAQGLWADADPTFSDAIAIDLAGVEASLAGPKRPQDRIALAEVGRHFADTGALDHGSVVIAAITSCTNTSNPAAMIGAGLLARKARALGLTVKPWVKTSLSPGSQVVTDYLRASGLQGDLDALGFHVVGHGCMTCSGNSGPLPEEVSLAIAKRALNVVAILSGNRNFEGRIHPEVRAAYLTSPALVVAYAIKGNIGADMADLAAIWPSDDEIRSLIDLHVNAGLFRARYADVGKGDARWQAIEVEGEWQEGSTYIKRPPWFDNTAPPSDIIGAHILAVLGDSVTTDHISPSGAIRRDSPAGHYLMERGVGPADFNSYGARRGNHDVMMRGTFANIRIRNKMAPGVEGGITRHAPTGQQMSIYDAAMLYKEEGIPLVIVAGKEYGTGSSRDWAAKGANLLGVRAVIAETYERIHRSNLVGMGVVPLQFVDTPPEFDGTETFTILDIADLTPRKEIAVKVARADGTTFSFAARVRIDTEGELEYFRHGGILHYVLARMLGRP